MQITTWNINSVRIRLPLIKQFLEQQPTDVLCLQETKTTDDHFPLDALMQMGFAHIAFRGQKSYNGMAICSKLPLSNIAQHDFLNNGEVRHLSAALPCGTELHNVYVPAGGDIPDVELNPKFKDKLAFMDALTAWSAQQKDKPLVLLGDMNIAPLEHDVWSHKQLLGVVSHTPIEVARMDTLQRSLGWVDAMREIVPPTEKLYSWWSYRARDWEISNRGRRLDHIWLAPALKSRLAGGFITAQARGWNSPSDHVPVTITLKG